MKESVKDTLVNSYLAIRSLLRFWKKGNDEPILKQCSFSDHFVSLDRTKWRIGQPWGMFHPDFPYQLYSEEAVHADGKLSLMQIPSGGSFPQHVGLVSSIDSFGYGFYRFRIKLPKGIGLWPAVWLTAVDSWPPEIDLMEAYSDEDGNWGRRIQSNMHWGLEKSKKCSGARNHMTDTESDIVVGCLFQENCIKIYYDGWLVRQITSENTMKWYKDKKMIIVLNNAVRPEFVNMVAKQSSKFVVYEVEFFECNILD